MQFLLGISGLATFWHFDIVSTPELSISLAASLHVISWFIFYLVRRHMSLTFLVIFIEAITVATMSIHALSILFGAPLFRLVVKEHANM